MCTPGHSVELQRKKAGFPQRVDESFSSTLLDERLWGLCKQATKRNTGRVISPSPALSAMRRCIVVEQQLL